MEFLVKPFCPSVFRKLLLNLFAQGTVEESRGQEKELMVLQIMRL